MRLNPFEDVQNEFELDNILYKSDWGDFKVKKEYKYLNDNNDYLDYQVLVNSINSKINWHILTTGSYQGDYWYIGNYNDKIYFVNIGYGSCSGCDSLMANEYNIQGLKSLQQSIKSDIREFGSMEELILWIINSNEWWLDEKDTILGWIKKEFNINFEILKTIRIIETTNKENE